MTTRKIILAVIAVIIVAGAVYAAKLIIDNKTAPKSRVNKEVKIVSTDTIQNGIVPVIIPANGNLRAKRRIELFAEVNGVFRNAGKLFRSGQEYGNGEVMIRIDNTEFYSQVQSARSNLNNQITSMMADLRLDYPDSYPQWQEYLDSWNISSSTRDLPAPINDKEKYFVTGRNIYTAYYNLKNLENRLAKFNIRAPFAGILTEAMVTEGTLIRPGQQLGEFIQKGTYELQVSISAEFADLLKVGEQVDLSNISGTSSYTGVVSRINGKVNQQSQTITTIIEISNPDLKEGMYLTASLDAQDISNAIELDRSLLQDDQKLFTVENDMLKLIDVEPVFFSDKTVVLKGVPDGTVIIARSVPGAYEGMIVKTEEQAQKDKKNNNIPEDRQS